MEDDFEPWVFEAMADDRLSTGEKVSIVAKVCDRLECKWEPFFVKQLLQHDGYRNHPEALASPSLLPFWSEHARRVRGAMGPVECRHARNKKDGDGSKPWDQFCAVNSTKEAHR